MNEKYPKNAKTIIKRIMDDPNFDIDEYILSISGGGEINWSKYNEYMGCVGLNCEDCVFDSRGLTMTLSTCFANREIRSKLKQSEIDEVMEPFITDIKLDKLNL